jgi:hypothetical protein
MGTFRLELARTLEWEWECYNTPMTLQTPAARAGGRTIEIPEDLYQQLQKILLKSRFNSVEDFALYVLRDLASHPSRVGKEPASPKPEGDQDPLTPEEIEIIQERLQNLGYL